MKTSELPAQIRECVDRGASPITMSEIKAKTFISERRVVRLSKPRPTLLGVAITGVAAAGIAGALVATQAGGSGSATGAVLTAATLKQMAYASATAMTSGQAGIDWSGNGSPSVVKQQISFDGANWNDVLNPGQPIKITHRTKDSIAWTGESTDRVVDGRNYHYGLVVVGTIQNPRFRYEWREIPGAAGSLNIPDPRSLVSLLSPSAGLVDGGTTTVNGVSLKHLHATTPGAVALQPLNDVIQSEPDNAKASAIDLWVNPSGVVLKAEITVSGTGTSGSPRSVTVIVTFSHIGQPQNITTPPTSSGS